MTRSARVGLLVVSGALLFLLTLFTIASRTFLFSNTFEIRSAFNNVSSLLPGAAVQYQGVNVGRVLTIELPARPGDKIGVSMAIQAEARHLIRTNTRAQIQTDGLVGNMIVVLIAGEADAPLAEAGSILPGIEPFSITAVTDQALSSVHRFNEAAETIQLMVEDIRAGEGTVGRLLYNPALYNALVQTTNETQRFMETLSRDAEAIVTLADNATQGVNSILQKIDSGDGTMARLLNDPEVYERLNRAADTLLTISTDIRLATRNTEQMTAWGALSAFRIAELTEAAKHNFLFRGYFERRGYVEQAPFELREQAIRASLRDLEAREQRLAEWEARLRSLEAAQTSNPNP